MLTIGPARLTRIVDLERFALPLDFLFPGATLEGLGAAALAPDHVDRETGAVLLAVQSHLLRIGGLTILIDTCVGADKPRPRRPDWHARRGSSYLTALAAAGLAPEDIDVVLCTHLHADHVGWNTRLVDGRWVPTFPRARYLLGGAELEHWRAEEARAPGSANHASYADSVLPVVAAGQVETVEDGAELTAGLSVRALPGHTRGQIGLCLCEQNQPRAFFCGDAFHSPLQVLRPAWSSRFCAEPVTAHATRSHLLAEAAATGALLVPAHLRNADAMTVHRDGDGYRPAFL